MEWKDGKKGNKFYSVCLIAKDGRRLAERLDSCVQLRYIVGPVQCSSNIPLRIYGEDVEPQVNYNFWIMSEDMIARDEAKEVIERTYKQIIEDLKLKLDR